VIAPCVLNATELRTAVVWLAIGCLVMRYVSDAAARNPGPDLPDLLWETNHKLGRAAFGWLDVPAPDAPRKYPRPRREMSQAQLDLAELVHAIPNDADWETWNNMGLAIYAASAGSEHGAVVFDDWSAKSLKYNPYTTAERWRHYHRSPPSRTGIGKLVKLALEAGWRPAESAKAWR